MIEKRFAAAIEWHAPDGDRNHLSAGCAMGSFHFIVRAIFPGADDQARVEYFSGYFELVG
jgi:hypothetical protein